MSSDLISRSCLHTIIGKRVSERHGYFSLRDIKEAIDNAPSVDTTCPHCDSGYAQGYSDGYLKGKEERPQGEFTDLERKVTADAINYLLGAELLEENGYTEEVINALKSALQKLGAEENHL